MGRPRAKQYPDPPTRSYIRKSVRYVRGAALVMFMLVVLYTVYSAVTAEDNFEYRVAGVGVSLIALAFLQSRSFYVVCQPEPLQRRRPKLRPLVQYFDATIFFGILLACVARTLVSSSHGESERRECRTCSL
jgi:hypothetical protein